MNTSIATLADNPYCDPGIVGVLETIRERYPDARAKVSVEYEDSGAIWFAAWTHHGDRPLDGIWIMLGGSKSLAGLKKLIY